VVRLISEFADRRLGKGVVEAKDTPNFIANRLGLYSVIRILELLDAASYTVDEIDELTGPAIGRPKSATLRTIDLTGLDVLVHVAANLADRLEPEEDRRAFTLPAFVDDMLRRGWIGEKGGQGFYKRMRTGSDVEIRALDPSRMEYGPRGKPRFPSLDAARAIEDPAERLRALFHARDRAGEFIRATLGRTLLYAARVAPQIARSIDDIDRAMKWGFAWEVGPFETWDALGIREVLEACGPVDPPPLVREALEAGRNRFREGPLPPAAPGLQLLQCARRRGAIVRSNLGASLVDLGDGVLCVEFHSKMNAIGGDTIEMLRAGVREAEGGYQALVVGNEAPNFSAGANLMLLLLEAQEENWDEIDLMVRAFQGATMALKHAAVPVVVTPAGVTLGGGCEILLHADRVQAAAESYIGLVEASVGLIPAGGGTKEMLARAVADVPQPLAPATDLLPRVQPVFETIGFAKVSTSAADARRLGLVRPSDAVTMNRERLVADAKQAALARAAGGYQPAVPREAIPVGGEPLLAALKLGVHLAWRAGRISDHDATIGRKLAWILAGGALPHPALVDEQYLLDLEREAFLSLVGERKTQERIQHTLKTGRPLRN
jgi:3-hydroxyacyl-CoA dehydrogenase